MLFLKSLFLLALVLAGAETESQYQPQQQLDAHLNAPTWSAVFGVTQLNMTMKQTQRLPLHITYIDPAWGEDFELHILPEDKALLHIDRVIRAEDIAPGSTSWSGNISVDALLLGHTSIYVELRRSHLLTERSTESLYVIIVRNIGTLDAVFKVCIGCFVMILYINFGAAIDLSSLKRILLRPVGPAIGFLGQFVFMPLLSFAIGYFLFRDMIELRLGLFFTGTTPGGGASNIFTVLLNGNLNLSITMTTLSNLLAFGMMPLWIFTLGALIFRDGNFIIPYDTIALMSFSLLVPLSMGIAIQKFAPDVAKKMTKLLKSISLFMMLFIMIFAFSVNLYMFKLFTWKILVASSALPWLGYCLGWLTALLVGQTPEDALTIAIETGIQNTGIAIFMLNFTLPQPQADMTSAVPVANSLMTPLPLLAIYVIRKCLRRTSIEDVEDPPTKEAKIMEVAGLVEKAQEAYKPTGAVDK